MLFYVKEDILKNAGNQTTDGPIDFYSIYFPTMEVNGDQQMFVSSKFFKISCFVFNIRKKLIQLWNDTRVSKVRFVLMVEYMRNTMWVNIMLHFHLYFYNSLTNVILLGKQKRMLT